MSQKYFLRWQGKTNLESEWTKKQNFFSMIKNHCVNTSALQRGIPWENQINFICREVKNEICLFVSLLSRSLTTELMFFFFHNLDVYPFWFILNFDIKFDVHVNFDTSQAKFKVLKFITFAVQLLFYQLSNCDQNTKFEKLLIIILTVDFQFKKELNYNSMLYSSRETLQCKLNCVHGRGGEGRGGEWRGCSVSSCSQRLKKCGNCRQKFYFRFVRKTLAIAPAALKDLYICFIN